MNLEKLNNMLLNKELDDILIPLYGESQLSAQYERYISAVNTFKTSFTDNDEVEIYSAPGRTEVGGNHTDHQHGQVLAASVDLDAIAIVSRRDDGIIRLISKGYNNTITIDTANISLDKKEFGTTTALIKGILKEFTDRGLSIGGFNAYVTSNVLIGAGLSSSAAFEAVVGTILSGMYNNMCVSSIDIAIIGQYAENVYFGKPCGLMDQMACSVGGFVHIDFADIKNPKIEQISFDLDSNGYALCIVDTKGSHADLTDDYAQIPLEMKTVAAHFGKDYLNEVDKDEFFKAIPELMKIVNHRAILRAIHFFEENNRVVKEANALKASAFDEFLSYVKESGSSSFRFLQNIYSSKELANQPVSVALAVSEHVLGNNGVSRVHGGGFAGTIQAFVKKEYVSTYQSAMDALFGNGACHILSIRNKGGIKVL